MKPTIYFRNSDSTFWHHVGAKCYAQVELVKRSFWFGRKWVQNGTAEDLSINPEQFEVVGDDLGRSMWDIVQHRDRMAQADAHSD